MSFQGKSPALEYFRKSGNRFFDKKHGKNKEIEPGFDSIKTRNSPEHRAIKKHRTLAPTYCFAASFHPKTAYTFWNNARTAIAIVFALFCVFGVDPAAAQSVTLDLPQGGGLTGRALQLVALITVLSLAPSILVMVTSFTRIVIVLSLLRTAMGVQQSPPNSVIISLALFLTAFVMSPVLKQSWEDGVKPLMDEKIELAEAFDKASKPVHGFMLKYVREKDLALFIDLSETEKPATPQDVKLEILVPAFMISELRRAFEIGFLLFVPFIVIDLVVASVLMSMGMMMLPPIIISLPFKLIFFVLVDGWHLVAGSLIKSF